MWMSPIVVRMIACFPSVFCVSATTRASSAVGFSLSTSRPLTSSEASSCVWLVCGGGGSVSKRVVRDEGRQLAPASKPTTTNNNHPHAHTARTGIRRVKR